MAEHTRAQVLAMVDRLAFANDQTMIAMLRAYADLLGKSEELRGQLDAKMSAASCHGKHQDEYDRGREVAYEFAIELMDALGLTGEPAPATPAGETT